MSRRTTPPADPRPRILVTLVVFCLVGVTAIAGLVDLAALRPERYRDLGAEQRVREVPLAGYRGTVYDRDGAVLATSMPGQQLVVDPQKVDDPEATARALAPVVGVEAAELLDPLTPDHEGDRYGLLSPLLDDEGVARLLALRADEMTAPLVRGVSLVSVEERLYPADRLARPVVGVVGVDEQGLYGVEWQFDEALRGEAGVDVHERSVFGIISVGERRVEPATPGNDIYLTIDRNIQYVVEEALIRHCEETKAASAQAVVSHPRTGEILAMATVVMSQTGRCVVPIYNAPLVNTFEPGSVIKLVTAAAAVEELGFTSGTIIDVPRSVVIEDKQFVEREDHVAAPYPLEQIIAQSMNVGTIRVAQQVGPERLRHYFEALGFGQETGLGFKDEAVGSVRDQWYGSDLGSIPIGQGMTANTVQLAMAYNTIANDGVYLSPTLVRSVLSDEGEPQPQPAQVARRVISPESAAEVTRMLTAVVDPDGLGTGTAAAVPGYTVAGKTGTAWKVFDDGSGTLSYGADGNRRYIVTFAGFLPAENPQLSIVVVVDEPQSHHSAAVVAAPVFADIAQYVVRILGIAPDHDALAGAEPVRAAVALADPDVGEAADDEGAGDTTSGGRGPDDADGASGPIESRGPEGEP